MTSRSARVIGVPTSAGAFAPGQEQAPGALRAAGFIEALVRAGLVVRDDGEPLVVLQRRFGRAHARLAARPAGRLDPDLLSDLARALRPEPAGGRRGAPRSVPVAALAGC